MKQAVQVFISCEHGGNRVPKGYRQIFVGHQALLETHRGYDIGILPFAEFLAAELQTPLISADVTRLLVDLNRSPGSRTLFSEITRALPDADKEAIFRRYHAPYWRTAENIVAGIIAAGRQALHLSIHSFTPVLNDQERMADIGLLYDPRSFAEKAFCLAWQKNLFDMAPTLRVRRNYPYRGNSDALVTALRKQFSPDAYLGIELEINQRLPKQGGPGWDLLQKQLLQTLRTTLTSSPSPGFPHIYR